MTKAEYDKRMPKVKLHHTKKHLIDKIWHIFTQKYGIIGNDAATEWPIDIDEYFMIIGIFPDYKGFYKKETYLEERAKLTGVNKKAGAPVKQTLALYSFKGKQGYFEFMKRLDKEIILGLYSWLNGRYLDYIRIGYWDNEATNFHSQKRVLNTMASALERPEALAPIRDL